MHLALISKLTVYQIFGSTILIITTNEPWPKGLYHCFQAQEIILNVWKYFTETDDGNNESAVKRTMEHGSNWSLSQGQLLVEEPAK